METRRKGVVGSPPISPFSARRKRRQSTDMGLLHGDPLSPLENSDLSDLLLKMRKEHTSAPQKDLRSRHKYNFIFRLLFIWLEPLFYLGARKELDQEDLNVNPKETDSEELLKIFNRHWGVELKRREQGRSARLWVALLMSILWRFILQGVLISLEAGILLYQSVILGQLSEYFSLEAENGESMGKAFLLAFGLVTLSLVVVIMHSHSFLMGQKMSMMLRVVSTAAIYQKVLSLSQATVGKLSVGHIFNLASNDVQRFDPVFPHLPYIWVSPLHLIVFTYLAYVEVGWSAFVATAFMLLQVPLQILFARLFIKFRVQSAELTDRRIHVMNEVISGIRVIKMYAWEDAFKKMIHKLRKKESNIIFKSAIIRACNLAYMIISTSIAMWLVLTIHTSTGGTITTRQAFTVLSLLTSLRLSSYFFVLGLLGYSEGRVAIHRIKKFLLVDEVRAVLGETEEASTTRKRKNGLPQGGLLTNSSSVDTRVCTTLWHGSKPSVLQFSQVSASWSSNEDKCVLKDINFEVNKDIPLLAVIGPVGAGKSSLLHCILGELPPLEGTVTVQGSFSYVSQEPWVFGGTIQENILFGKPYNAVLYNKVLKACLLDEDIEQFPLSDMTMVGERGMTLSGGQKARVNLARAIYNGGNIFLLDDPLCALDVNVAAHIYDNCIHELLQNKLVVLVTHQIQYALKANKILLIKEGRQELYNSHAELLAKGLDLAYLIGLVHKEDEDEDERNMYNYKKIDDPPSPTIISLLSTDPFDEACNPPQIPEMISSATEKTTAITPLALFSKAVRENLPLGKPYTGTNDIVVKRKPRFFIFPANEGQELEENKREDDTGRHECPVNCNSLVIQNNNVGQTIEVHVKSPSLHSSCNGSESSVPWPFAGLPPGKKNPRGRNSNSAHLDAWPFANRPPGFSGHTSYRKKSICAALLSPPQNRKKSICAALLSPPQNRKNSMCVTRIASQEVPNGSQLDSGIDLDSARSANPSPLPFTGFEHSPILERSRSSDMEDTISKCSLDSKLPSVHMDFLLPTTMMTPGLPSRFTQNRPSSSHGRQSEMSIRSTHSRTSCAEFDYRLNIQPSPFDTVSIYSTHSKFSTITVNASRIAAENPDQMNPPEVGRKAKRKGMVSLKTYYTYFTAGGSILLLAVTLLLLLLGEAGIVISDWWLSDWASCFGAVNSSGYCYLSNTDRIYVYTFTTAISVGLNFTRVVMFCFICIHASMVLHNHMFNSVLGTKLSFFNNNSMGKILNRFSKDVGFLDDLLPFNFCEFLLLSLRCTAIVLTATSSNPYLIVPALLMTVLFIGLRWYYLKSARDVKRIESIARSPVYSHLSSTLQGLCTIRSYQQENIALEKLHALQNEHSQVWYLYLVMIRWFGIRVDVLSVFFLASVAFISIPLASGLNAGLIGLSLTYTISLADMLQYTIRLSAEVENTMISAERVMEYGRLEPEDSSTTSKKEPPKDWPKKGDISMEDVSFKYESDQPNVLSNLSFNVNNSEKVGIVGRTGAGKSSLISVLYRLGEPHGKIVIDGIDTSSISLQALRKQMSIIPQDPVLFSGSVRYNLDPFGDYSDFELWDALDQVQLKSMVQAMDGQLEGEVSEGGSNFSVGQRQLVCLARALLRKNKIIILDEATANVDPRTDGIIQKAIQDNFSDCTVLVIAHRLNTIVDSDKLMFLGKGNIMEFDSPYKLLQNPNSHFYLMVEKTGETASGGLHQLALESHLQRMFKKSGRLTSAEAKFGVRNMSYLFAKSLLQRTTGSGPFGLSRLQERRASMLSSNSFPRALNEVGLSEDENEEAND